MTQSTRFAGKTVIVTGSSTGIGAGIAKRVHDEGANVIINARNAQKCEELAATLEAERTLVVPGDVSKSAFADEIVAAAVEKFGGLDVLVNNAGVGGSSMLHKTSDDEIDRIIDINVKGVIYLCRAAIPHLQKNSGSIVNISSVSGIGGDSLLPVYNASKGAVTNLTRGLALQVGGMGIRVNAINPSITRSDMVEDITGNDALMQGFMQRVALGRIGEPEDIAAAAAFLASEDASFITGVNLPVDGGVSASNGQPNFMALL
ncbi:SDR family NAD(P)-dependent oxidoreductase [Congregibacter litoralis]|uniref:Ketoreductase domain-containing protein n=1 Tax=Congregibacter litoralis KT71 TaxID=314285 RepID=A4A6Z7_9GAMM|nr:SDR family oxidoreductase [Congregibacter litoralis]EAQ98066.1 Dehydrogenase with unknown specificity [Congregibacter litoralis KT71]